VHTSGFRTAFASNVKSKANGLWPQVIESRVGKFSVLDPQVPQRHHEAIEYLARRNSLHRSRLMRKTGEPHVMAMARLGCFDVPRIAARRRDDCERERRANVRVSRIVGDPRITLLIVDQCQGPPTGATRYLI
jgi:hypothetical protein